MEKYSNYLINADKEHKLIHKRTLPFFSDELTPVKNKVRSKKIKGPSNITLCSKLLEINGSEPSMTFGIFSSNYKFGSDDKKYYLFLLSENGAGEFRYIGTSTDIEQVRLFKYPTPILTYRNIKSKEKTHRFLNSPEEINPGFLKSLINLAKENLTYH